MTILCATSRAQVRREEVWRKTGVYKLIREDYEPHFDKASPSAVVVRRIL